MAYSVVYLHCYASGPRGQGEACPLLYVLSKARAPPRAGRGSKKRKKIFAIAVLLIYIYIYGQKLTPCKRHAIRFTLLSSHTSPEGSVPWRDRKQAIAARVTGVSASVHSLSAWAGQKTSRSDSHPSSGPWL